MGATGSAAVPLAMDHAGKTGAVSKGNMVMLLASETSRWKYAAGSSHGPPIPVAADKRFAADAQPEVRPPPRPEVGRLRLAF